MNTSLDKVRDETRYFVRETLEPALALVSPGGSDEDQFASTRPAYEALVGEGYLSNLIPVAFGGRGLSASENFAIIEELAKANVSVTLTMLATTLGLAPILAAAPTETARKLVAPFVRESGAPLAAFAFSEPGGTANYNASGVDRGLATQAELGVNGWTVSGAKSWISNSWGWEGKGPDILTLVAKVPGKGNTVFYSVHPHATLRFVEAIESGGLDGHLLPQIEFHDFRIPPENVIGEVGQARPVVEAAFGSGAGVGALAVGVARRAFDFVQAWAAQTTLRGDSYLLDSDRFAYALIEQKIRLEAIAAVVDRAARAIDSRSSNAFELGLVSKIFVSETATQIVIDLANLLGVRSLSTDHPLASMIQESLYFPLVSGSNHGFRRPQIVDLLREQMSVS